MNIILQIFRGLLIGAILPSYLLVWITYKSLMGFTKTYILALTGYVVTLKDRFYATFIFLIIVIYICWYLKPWSTVLAWLKPNQLDDLKPFFILISFFGIWFKKFFWFSIAFTLADELVFKSYLNIGQSTPFSPEQREKLRQKAYKNNAVFAGYGIKDHKPLFITNEMRAMHVNTIGTPGTGKTESFILPWSFQDIMRGNGVIIADAKGSMDFYKKLWTYVKTNQCPQKMFLINLGDPNFSNSYNPIFHGNAVELKDRIMGAFKWSEEFYRASSEKTLLTVLSAIEAAGKKVTFNDLYLLLTEIKSMEELIQLVPDKRENFQIRRQLILLLENYRKAMDNCAGLINNLMLMGQGGLSQIVNVYNPDVDLLEVYKQNEIVFFSLPTNLKGETSRAFGRMLLMDLKSTAGYIELGQARKHFFPVFIDEFSEFANGEFIGWLNKSRSSGMAVHMAYQSLGDLQKVDPSFPVQVGDNTNLNVTFRVNDPDTAENICTALGTYRTEKETKVVDKTFLVTNEGFRGSVREVDEFKVHPNVLKCDLKRGQALIFGKHPSFFCGLYNTDYLPDPKEYVPVEIIHDDVEKATPDQFLNMDCIFDLEEPIENLETLAVGSKHTQKLTDDSTEPTDENPMDLFTSEDILEEEDRINGLIPGFNDSEPHHLHNEIDNNEELHHEEHSHEHSEDHSFDKHHDEEEE